MKTAAEFVEAAATMASLATQMKTEPSDPYVNQRILIQYHLNNSALLALEIAEAIAERERR